MNKIKKAVNCRAVILLIALAAITQLGSFSTEAVAQEGLLNKLLAPGPLIEAHKELEHKDCLECHTTAEGVPNSNCLECHKEIKASIDRKQSFHGKRKKACHECHPDHKGRKSNTMKVDEKTFDHKKTSYPLVGKHKKIKCVKCHTEKRTKKAVRKNETRWFGKERSCLECHKSDDIHFFKDKFKNSECSECHSQESWKKKIKFDHLKDGGYRLKGDHAKLKCKKCHIPNGKKSAKYKWPKFSQKRCLSCHKDNHKTNLSPKYQGGKCDKCHKQTEWKIRKFSHNLTGFDLKGKHSRVGCVKCHKQTTTKSKKNYKWRGLKNKCLDCHKDYHAFATQTSKRFGPLGKCDRCHTNESFKKNVDFNHSLDTRFKLDGQHSKKNKCIDCHVAAVGQNKKRPKKRIYRWRQLDTKTCETCHKSPHKKTFPPKLLRKKCTECHLTTGWKKVRKGKGFSHDATRFPLVGKHQKVKCDTCHIRGKKQVFKFPFAERQFCQNCHKNVHKKQFDKKFSSKSCAECHTPRGFTKRKPFNHNKTKFKLTGQHAKIKNKCSLCHIKTRSYLPTKPRKRAGQYLFAKNPKKLCESCHESPHDKQFDEKFGFMPCLNCHTTTSFSKRKKFDHRQTRFEIKGAHTKVKCAKCHVPTKKWLTRKPPKKAGRYLFPSLMRKDCNTCHKDPHRGSFGTKCSQCHSEKKWKSTRDFHKDFTLSGIHYTLQCEECHVDNRRLGGMSSECLVCHQKDDVHNATLPNCSECHRQNFWESTKFDHSLTLFPLRGAHRVQECSSCHANGRYTGRPAECESCHTSDRLNVTSPDHSGASFNQCVNCHKNQFSFKSVVSP
jgi:hypothetical protein